MLKVGWILLCSVLGLCIWISLLGSMLDLRVYNAFLHICFHISTHIRIHIQIHIHILPLPFKLFGICATVALEAIQLSLAAMANGNSDGRSQQLHIQIAQFGPPTNPAPLHLHDKVPEHLYMHWARHSEPPAAGFAVQLVLPYRSLIRGPYVSPPRTRLIRGSYLPPQ